MPNFFAKPPGQKNHRGYSRELWLRCPREEIRGDRGVGVYFEDDFTTLPTGKYTATQATAGTFALTDAEFGVALADCASSTNGQGINIQTPAAFIKPAAGVNIWGEARLKIADAATPPEFFFVFRKLTRRSLPAVLTARRIMSVLKMLQRAERIFLPFLRMLVLDKRMQLQQHLPMMAG